MKEKERGTQIDKVQFFSIFSFFQADYVPDSERQFEPQYDTITAFSVTKWIHLVHGDEGLRRFFRRVYAELREGGYFIVEPQPLRSYRRSYRAVSLQSAVIISSYSCACLRIAIGG